MPLIIDSHQHFWDVKRFDYGWLTPKSELLYRNYLPAELAPILRANGVERTVFVQAMSSTVENDFALELAEANPFIAGIVGWIDIRADDAKDVIARYAARPGFVGVRINIDATSVAGGAAEPKLARGLRWLADANLSCDVLAWGDNLSLLPTVARAAPDLRIVLDHLGGLPLKPGKDSIRWRTDISAAGACVNVHCKVSGMITQAAPELVDTADYRSLVRHVIDAFGARRLMFGSDWPVCLQAGSYERVINAFNDSVSDLTPTERAEVTAGTATRVYRLG